MNALNILNTRLAARPHPGPEQELAFVRVTMVALLLSYALYVALPNGRNDGKQIVFLVAYLAFAITMYVATRLRPAVNVSRRVLSTVVDAGAVTGVLILAGNDVALFVGLYLFFIFGNGFTYGRLYLYLSQLLCIAGFMLVIASVPWWQDNLFTGTGWLVALVVLPFYVSFFAERIKAERAKAEQALKECLERNRGEVA